MMCLCNGVGLSLTRIIDVSGVWNLGIVSWGGAVAKLERNRGGTRHWQSMWCIVLVRWGCKHDQNLIIFIEIRFFMHLHPLQST
jgi:hypothetical protein